MKSAGNQWSSNSNSSRSTGGSEAWRSDDGGWSKGPPATGSGWSYTIESGTSNGNSQQDLRRSWNNQPGSGSDWQQRPSSVIFDRNDKEAWPSIRDNSENTSENGDDNSSVKSGSVISSSSSSQGQETSQESSAMQMQGQSASSVWGANNNYTDIDSNWGITTPSSSAANNTGWGSGPNTSLSNNSNNSNQGYNMQTGASSIGSESLNTINSNPMLSAGRLGWGAPGSVPPSQSAAMANRMPSTQQVPRSTAGINGNSMQGSLPASGAQPNGPQLTQSSGIATSVQSSGPNSLPVSQGTGSTAFSSGSTYLKTSMGSDSNWSSSSGFVMNPGTSIINATSGNNAQSGDNLASGWGTPSSSDNSTSAPSGAGSWGNPNLNPGSDWGTTPQSTSMSHTQQQIGASANPNQQNQSSSASPFMNPSTTQGQQGQQTPGDQQQRPTSWAQAAVKGLNIHSSTNMASNAEGAAQGQSADLEKESRIRDAIENHDGWGKQPIRQDTEWNIETSPKLQRKISSATVVPDPPKGANNMWNNNNGTAIWEANKDNATPWNSAAGAPRVPVQRPPAQPGWNGTVQKPQDQPGNNWGPGGGGPGPGPGVGPAPGQSMGPGADKAIGSWGPEGNPSSNQGNWGGSTETGSWSGNYGPRPDGSTGAISTWGEPDNAGGWNNDPQRRSGNNDGTSYWGESQSKPPPQQNWNNPNGPPSQPTMMPRMKPEEWNPSKGPKPSGWGDTTGPPDPKIDDGTGLWTSNNQQQARAAAGWGDASSQQGSWNPAIGKPKPPPTMAGAGWQGDNDMNWNSQKDDVWNEENMGGFDDADMGTWNDVSQEVNSSWNSATGWNRNKRNSLKGPIKYAGGNQPPQMRSRMLQQMMDMGFKKDEAQHALIKHNMNLPDALHELCNRQGPGIKKDMDMDMFQMDGAKKMMPGLQMPDGSGANDDISDTQSDSNSFVPNINSMQNTPFQNAQSQLPNQFPYKGPSLSQSSLNPNNPSISMLQQKIMQKFHNQQQQPPPPPPPTQQNSIPPTQGQIGRGQLSGNQPPNTHQHLAQQQILQQLRMAVQAGLISPQLLNQQLPPPVLVMLQQLLQQQQLLQNLINTQQMLQQTKIGVNPMVQRQHLDQTVTKINSIKQQILLIQKQISQAQNALLKPQQQQQQQAFPPQTSTQEADPLTTLPSDLGNISLSSAQPQAQSRLNQWKRPTPDRDTPPVSDVPSTNSSGDANALNKAVGSKSMQQSQSTPNLRRFDELGLSLGGGGDWSSPPTSSAASLAWPNSSSPTEDSSPTDGQTSIADTQESQSSATTTTTTTTNNSSNSSSSSTSSILNINDSIPEFIPGKPWQGKTSMNVEDDPYITPGSISRSLSVNTIKDDYLNTLTKTSANEGSANWPSKPISSQGKAWSPAEFNDVWSEPFSKGNMSRPPPGLPQQQNKAGWIGVNRQTSWTPGMKTEPPSAGGSWDRGSGNPSTALILKNLTPQIDGSTLRTLCMQHGPLNGFYLNLGHGQALVKYNTKEEASKAQKSLNTCLLGNTTIVAEFVPESEIARFTDHQSAMSVPSQWSQQSRGAAPGSIGSRVGGDNSSVSSGGGHGSWSMGVPTSSFSNPLPPSTGWGSSGMGGGSVGGGTLWGSVLEDHGTHNLLGNMLGETM